MKRVNNAELIAELIKSYKEGNNEAFEILLGKYKLSLFNYILRMVGIKEVAEDIFQDVWIQVIKVLPRYREQNKFSSLLFKLANSKSIDYLRKNKRDLQCGGKVEGVQYRSEVTSSMQSLIEKKEILSLLNNTVMELPAKQKEVFLLRQHSGLSFKEIAGILDCPLNTVLARMHNAILNLRKTLKEEK